MKKNCNTCLKEGKCSFEYYFKDEIINTCNTYKPVKEKKR